MPRRRASIQAPTSNESDTAIVQSDSQETTDYAVVDQVVEEEVVVEAPVRQSKTLSTEVGPVTTKEQPQPESGPVVGVPDGLILGPNEPLRIEGEDMGNVVIVKQDIYRQVFPRRSTRPSYVLVYPRGAQVLKSTLVPIPDK
jgi:hypothetical protein